MSENNVIENTDNNDRDKGISKWRLFLCYLLAAAFGLFIMFAVGGPAAAGINYVMGYVGEREWNWFTIFQWVGFGTLLFLLTQYFGNTWRAKEDDIKAGVTDFANPFYDPDFEPGSYAFKRKYRQLLREHQKTKLLLQRVIRNGKATHENLLELQESLQVFIRHHDNANRLLGSASYLLMNGGQTQFVDTMLHSVLNECTTILQRDYNDKSIALYQVDGECLVMRSYSRISAESAANRKFKKGEGFAGFVWESNEPTIEFSIDIENDPRFQGNLRPKHGFKSILGLPISIGGDVLGVLCLQCERENGFTQEDLRAVTFYANCCSLILLYDKLSLEGRGS
ncbi:GAF domain-containing protein [Brevibacillus sp. 179-C9.3 HS]|uniref:GAF domain-containing protein n=1 Tax=unclassified Brevibacillus TaxID=2684853 RepID=UPI0039A338FB